MVKEKVCKSCKIIFEGDKCPICKDINYTNSYQGKVYIIDANKSFIAQQINIKEKGKYAMKIK